MKKKIFISYRRADTKGYAHAIYNLLVSEFGENNIFMDVDTIHPGEDFVKRLETEINSCDVVLALIGPDWLDIKDQQGNKRLDDPSDFVRQEIEAALRNDIYIIPMLLQEAKMPKRDDLSGGLKALANRQAFVIGDHLISDVERLIREIESFEVGKKSLPVARPKDKKERKFPWLKWASLSLVTTPIVLILFMYVSNLIWYYASNYYLLSRPFVFIGLQAVVDTKTFFIYLLLCEGIVSSIQWLAILRIHEGQGLFWVITNSVIGLVTGFIMDIFISNKIMSDTILLLGAMVMLWLLYNILIGPILLNKRISTSGYRLTAVSRARPEEDQKDKEK